MNQLPPALDLTAVLSRRRVSPRWLVEDVFARDTLIILGGESATGKSVLSYYLSYCVALGLPFLGRPTTQTSVVYFDEENSLPTLVEYNQLIWRGLGMPEPSHIPLYTYSFSLTDAWFPQMKHAMERHHPGLVVIDTATPALSIKNENENAEASLAIQNLRRVQESAANDTAIIVLKHELDSRDADGKRHKDRTVRGAKIWIGAVDQVVYFSRDAQTRSDGLHMSKLTPAKTRAFGLRQEITIDPAWTGEGDERGLTLAPRTAAKSKPLAAARQRLQAPQLS